MIEFEEFGLPVPELGVTVGRFDGRFHLNGNGEIDYIELTGDFKVNGKWHHEPVTVRKGHRYYELLAEPLLAEYAETIAEREAAERPYRDRFGEFRLSAAQLGVGR